MLVKAIKNPIEDPVTKIFSGYSGEPFEELEVGSYLSQTFSFEYVILGDWDRWPGLSEVIIHPGASMGLYSLSPRGVCDSPEQFWETEIGKFIRESDRPFCVSFVHIDKSQEPSEEGWRWHKWGPYIGKGEPECEYLYYEEGFENGVYTYHVLERKTVVNVPEIQAEIDEVEDIKKELAGKAALLKMKSEHNPNADIDSINKEIDELEKEQQALDLKKSSAEGRLRKMIAQKMQLNVTSITLGKYWECKESPTGYCIYNHDKDPLHDECLVCGFPEERA